MSLAFLSKIIQKYFCGQALAFDIVKHLNELKYLKYSQKNEKYISIIQQNFILFVSLGRNKKERNILGLIDLPIL